MYVRVCANEAVVRLSVQPAACVRLPTTSTTLDAVVGSTRGWCSVRAACAECRRGAAAQRCKIERSRKLFTLRLVCSRVLERAPACTCVSAAAARPPVLRFTIRGMHPPAKRPTHACAQSHRAATGSPN